MASPHANFTASSSRASTSAIFEAELVAFCGPIEQFLDLNTGTNNADVEQLSIHLMEVQEALESCRSLNGALQPQVHDHAVRRLFELRERLEVLQQGNSATNTQHQPQTWYRGARGARTLVVDSDQLVGLTNLGFTDKEIAAQLNCSVMTIRRHRSALGLRKRGRTEPTLEQLSETLSAIRSAGTEQLGERAMLGALRAQQLPVTRARLRTAMRQNDPNAGGRRRPIERRTYRVPFVNSLWHLDGHHKLIKWRFVIHAAIDGKSRAVTFIKASSNNMATTVADAFLTSTQTWGWPSRVRADHGGENLVVKELMEQQRGRGRGSFIQGSSVHNQRIERLWVDVQAWMTKKYKALFVKLEDQHYLDVDNAVHLWTLHFVFLPRLNRALQTGQRMWNYHPMRTPGLGNKSPLKLFLKGALAAKRMGAPIVNEDQLRALTHDSNPDCARREAETLNEHVEINALAVPPVLLERRVQIALRSRLNNDWPLPEDEEIAVFRHALLLVNILLASSNSTQI
ncbi:hypothetical protein CF319_g6374 [Tilletia indica]|nr:hypothetical protein CF319_g6374 [Tilletia indica]